MPVVHTGVAAAPLAFFSFPEVLDPARHRDYNAWHQLDHLPENRALRGVLHGERWVRTPACRAATARLGLPDDPTLGAAQYVAMYWFAETCDGRVEPHVDEWRALGESTRRAGRRPEIPWTVRRLTDFFRPETGAVAPAALVSAGALPFRPHRGGVIAVARVRDPDVPAPALALAPGVAGAWTFAGTRRRQEPPHGWLRITLHYCESDPLEVGAAMGAPAAPGTEPLLRTPLLPVVPWQWDWFESEETDGPA